MLANPTTVHSQELLGQSTGFNRLAVSALIHSFQLLGLVRPSIFIGHVLFTNLGIVASLLRQITQDGVAGIPILHETFDTVGMGKHSRPHDVTARHAVADLNVGMLEPEGAAGERIDIW